MTSFCLTKEGYFCLSSPTNIDNGWNGNFHLKNTPISANSSICNTSSTTGKNKIKQDKNFPPNVAPARDIKGISELPLIQLI